MANLNIGASLATVNTLASLPVTKGTIYATLSAPTNLSLAAAMYQGQVLEVIINPSAFMNIPMPTASGWYSTFGETLTLMKDVRTVLKILCIGSGQYLTSANNEVGQKTNGYEYVDLGLPSGIKWATSNIGATQPHEYGLYFQWGGSTGRTTYTNTSGLEDYGWKSTPFNGGTNYFNESYYDSVINSVCSNGILNRQYDTAAINMGGEWRMPTSADTWELRYNTTGTSETISGVSGMRFTGPNGNSMFMPHLHSDVAVGPYWSSSHYVQYKPTNYKEYAIDLLVGQNMNSVYPLDSYSRFQWLHVRGVLD